MKPAKITLRNGRDRAQAARWLDKCPLGYTLLFKPPTRTNIQNARMWALLDDVAAQKEWAGRKWPSEAWKDLFAASLFGQELVPNLDNNGFVAFHSRTSEFSPETMSDMITLIESWGASHCVRFTDTPQAEQAGTHESHAYPEESARSPAPAANLTPTGAAGGQCADEAEPNAQVLASSARKERAQ